MRQSLNSSTSAMDWGLSSRPASCRSASAPSSCGAAAVRPSPAHRGVFATTPTREFVLGQRTTSPPNWAGPYLEMGGAAHGRAASPTTRRRRPASEARRSDGDGCLRIGRQIPSLRSGHFIGAHIHFHAPSLIVCSKRPASNERDGYCPNTRRSDKGGVLSTLARQVQDRMLRRNVRNEGKWFLQTRLLMRKRSAPGSGATRYARTADRTGR